MPGFVVQVGATVICAHAGQAQPLAPFPRVLLSGTPVVTLASPFAVAGCTQPAVLLPPCVIGEFVAGAARVFAGGVPVVIQGGTSVCVPNGTPLTVVAAQTRVIAS